jgi:hypothetical protein
MRYTFGEEFRLDHPETVGETDRHFDLYNYKDWLEAQLIEARKQLALCNVVGPLQQPLVSGSFPLQTKLEMFYDFLFERGIANQIGIGIDTIAKHFIDEKLSDNDRR